MKLGQAVPEKCAKDANYRHIFWYLTGALADAKLEPCMIRQLKNMGIGFDTSKRVQEVKQK